MKKVLFIGIQRMFLEILVRNIQKRSRKKISEVFLANNPNEAITIAKGHPDISVVFFMGYLATARAGEEFQACIGVAEELGKTLNKGVTMIAATGNKAIDAELLKHHCQIAIAGEQIIPWITENIS